MVLIAVPDGMVGAETLTRAVVIVIHSSSRPSVTLDAEMVVRLACQFALSCPTLKNTLGECDTGRNMIFLHLLDSQGAIAVEILLIGSVTLHLSRQRNSLEDAEQEHPPPGDDLTCRPICLIYIIGAESMVHIKKNQFACKNSQNKSHGTLFLLFLQEIKKYYARENDHQHYPYLSDRRIG